MSLVQISASRKVLIYDGYFEVDCWRTLIYHTRLELHSVLSVGRCTLFGMTLRSGSLRTTKAAAARTTVHTATSASVQHFSLSSTTISGLKDKIHPVRHPLSRSSLCIVHPPHQVPRPPCASPSPPPSLSPRSSVLVQTSWKPPPTRHVSSRSRPRVDTASRPTLTLIPRRRPHIRPRTQGL